MSLPEEFLLLCHLPSGKVPRPEAAAAGCAAAELGELALRRRVRAVARRKTRVFGFDGYVLPGRIQVLDHRPTGVGWADGLLAELGRSGGAAGQVKATRWVRRRRKDALALHREKLLERGALRSRGRMRRPCPDEAARDALIDRLRAVSGGRAPMDEHALLLLDLLDGAGMWKHLGLRLSTRQRLDRGRGTGPTAELSEEIRETSAVICWEVPSRTDAGGGIGLGGGG